MKIFIRLIPLLVATGFLAGCSNIGKINGQNISRVTGEDRDSTFCERNPAVCIIGITAGLGGTALIIRNATKSSSPAPVVQPPMNQ